MGGQVISAELIHTMRIMVKANLFDLLFLEYLSGWVTARYLSTLMAHKLRMEAVHKRISRDTHMSHNTLPNFQTPENRNDLFVQVAIRS